MGVAWVRGEQRRSTAVHAHYVDLGRPTGWGENLRVSSFSTLAEAARVQRLSVGQTCLRQVRNPATKRRLTRRAFSAVTGGVSN